MTKIVTHSGFQRYFFNTGWMFAEKILRLIGGLFVGAYVARYLGPIKFGLLNYVISLTSIFSVLATLGLDTLVILELIKNEKKKDAVLGTAFGLRVIAASIVILLLLIMIKTTHQDDSTAVLVYIIGCGAFFEAFGVIDYFFQSRVLSKFAVWSQMIALIIISIVRILLIGLHASLEWFAITYVLDFIIIAIGLVLFYSKNIGSIFNWKFDLAIGQKFLKDCWPLITASLAVTIYMRISQIMIKWMLGDEANGNYSVAVRLCEMWNFIPMAVCASVFPAILNAKQSSEELYLKRLQQLYDMMVVVSVGIALPMTFLSSFIVGFLFGNAYSEASSILVLYIWSSVFIFLGVANGKWIVSENLQIFRMTTLVISGILNIALNYILIKVMGLNGAAVSSLITYAFAGYFCFLFTEKTRTMFISMSRSFNPFRLIRLFTKSISI